MVNDGIVYLDLSSIQTLQCALRRNKHFSLMSSSRGESREDRMPVGARANGGRAREGRERGASCSGYGGTRRAPESEKRRELSPAGYEAAVTWRLFCLSREITTLRIHRWVMGAHVLGQGNGSVVAGFFG